MKHRGVPESFKSNHIRGSRKHSPSQDTKDKIAETLKGRKRPPEVIEKVRAAKAGKKQKPRSEEAQKRMKAAQEIRRAKEAQQPTKHLTPEHKAKLSTANQGKKPVNVGNGIPAWNKGIPMSEEQKAKLIATHKDKLLPSEHKRKISEGLTRHYQAKKPKDNGIHQIGLWDDAV